MARHLSHDEFFDKLADLFEQRKSKGHGSIFLVQKRLSYGQDVPVATDTDPFPDLNPTKPLPVLVRASNGKSKIHRDAKIKLSTVVEVDALDAFYARYADLCKSGMTALKPRDRSKKKAKARRKKGGAPTVTAS
ncbi:Signal recognition particle subunit srp14 [Colletotrichum sp. SAR 10_70]|nr:Signal recognition particle subunit srp14 [Colletotrichum sp. SAR 10_71]KAI8175014.1 Signal recognition particle subunit srp14 [Colletotrichum sp. SAR 10_75]KAI8186825.1 Signal recognition particle subunit srp14 [Colletotrichum sp. SAR 10_70]KAI8192687.1 Signal recognition particle subunit srp14 [Colletotrichum sp. SAR 10_65]KAI8209517.1 Signal recognition particle subunit srp14 [Colletotrichum sp. SAR 10_76]KAI8217770.1 Signal recognition particle subunit srp14 [Colletotrichum sp. SAR 10_8